MLVRSILLRGFDQDVAERAGAYMQRVGTTPFFLEFHPFRFYLLLLLLLLLILILCIVTGVKFIRPATPTEIIKVFIL